MNVTGAILTRRTIKQFKPDPVPMENVLAWLSTAAYAPNHRMTEPWEVYVVGPSTRANLKHKNDFGGAPLLLAVASTPAKTSVDRDEHLVATACFIQNFMLAAHAEGVGTGWSSLGASPRVRELLALPQGQEIIGFLPVGYPLEVPEPKLRTPIEQKLHDLP
ncbi:nitroreductase [Tumebacillus algifaecis]|uniref:Nitroreductase n=2 Tax=Tumebacillus algifaecis TaxID=1214604 RepID=A0A223D2Q1_9BACL|nr:nitroreductase [Tumebacillus algifaecis]